MFKNILRNVSPGRVVFASGKLWHGVKSIVGRDPDLRTLNVLVGAGLDILLARGAGDVEAVWAGLSELEQDRRREDSPSAVV